MTRLRIYMALVLAFTVGFAPVATLAGCAPSNNYVAAFVGPDMNVKNYGATGLGVADEAVALAAVIAAIPAGGASIVFPTGTYRLASNITFPTTSRLVFMKGAKLTMDAGVTATLAGGVSAGADQQIFGFVATSGSDPAPTTNPVILSGAVAEIYPEWWGAKGDNGTTNNYGPIQALKMCMNVRLGGVVKFQPGTYKIDSYLITGGGSANTIADITWTGLNGAQFLGYGTKLDMKGDFLRVDTDGGGAGTTSYMRGVNPLRFTSCTNVTVEGFEVDGNVDQMTRDAGVTEPANEGLYLTSVQQFTAKSMYIHHMAADGVYIVDTGGLNSKNVMFANVKSLYNGRQGMSVTGGRFITAVNCEFSYTGLTNAAGTAAGAYGSHSPGAGVDVEPNRVPATVSDYTGEITFTACRFVGNVGAQVIATRKAESVVIDNCWIDNKVNATLTGSYCVILGAQHGRLTNSVVKTGTNEIYLQFTGELDSFLEVKGNTIYTSGKGLIADRGLTTNQTAVVEGNRIIGQHRASGAQMPYFNGSSLVTFKNNWVWYPKEMHDGTTWSIPGLFDACREISGNTFATDLVDTAVWWDLPMDAANTPRVFGNQMAYRTDYDAATAWVSGTAYASRTREVANPGRMYITYLGMTYINDTEAWTAGDDLAAGAYVTNGGYSYQCAVDPGAVVLSYPPTHASGTVVATDGYSWTKISTGSTVAPTHKTGAVTGADGYTWRAAPYAPRFSHGTTTPYGSGAVTWQGKHNTFNDGDAPIGATDLYLRNSATNAIIRMSNGAGGLPAVGSEHKKGSVCINETGGTGVVPFQQCTTAGIYATAAWASAATPANGDHVVNSSKVYRLVGVGGGTTADAPTHTSPYVVTGADGYTWFYLGPLAVFQTALPLGTTLPVANGGTGSATAAFSGANITELSATQLTTGTMPDARFPATLPVASGVNLTGVAKTSTANALTGDQTVSSGDLVAATAGRGLRVKEGANARMGTATLTAGSVTISNTSINANTRVQLTRAAAAGIRGFLTVGIVTAGASFVVRAEDSAGSLVADTSSVNWLLIEPSP